jgi:aryl sulfotransferase
MLIRPALREYRTWTQDSRRWNAYEPRPGDIVIATAPKCGTTWMQQIVSSLVFQDGAAHAFPLISPYVDARVRMAEVDMYRKLAEQTHRRFVKTHLPVDGIPLYDEVLYVHVARDGRDAALSGHNHFADFKESVLEHFDHIGMDDPTIAMPHPRLPKDPAEYFQLWLTTPSVAGQSDGIPNLSFFDLEVGYWRERHRPNFLMVHYNDMIQDLDGEMRRVAAFLGIAVNETVWPSLVQAATFERMRDVGDQIMPAASNSLQGGSRRFFHRGTTGRWRSVLPHNDLALYDAKVRAKFTPGLAAWVERGRLVTGEPSRSPD